MKKADLTIASGQRGTYAPRDSRLCHPVRYCWYSGFSRSTALNEKSSSEEMLFF